MRLLPTFRPQVRTADSVGLPLTTGSFPSYKTLQQVEANPLVLHTHTHAEVWYVFLKSCNKLPISVVIWILWNRKPHLYIFFCFLYSIDHSTTMRQPKGPHAAYLWVRNRACAVETYSLQKFPAYFRIQFGCLKCFYCQACQPGICHSHLLGIQPTFEKFSSSQK